MPPATVSRWSRALVAAGVVFLVAWAVAGLLGATRATSLAFGLYGFVFCVVFGKAYALVPAYFARQLARPRAPAIHLPFAVVGALGLALAGTAQGGTVALQLGAVSWALGVLIFVGTLGWTIRDNLTGRETATSEANIHRIEVDRFANGFMPVVLLYLLLAAAVRVATATGSGTVARPVTSHLLAVGAATLLVFAVGFRLLPRFMVVTPPRWLVRVVLPAGAFGPLLLAADFLGGTAFLVGAVIVAVAVTGFALAYLDMYRRTDRDRVGFHGVAAAAVAGLATVTLGLLFAHGHLEPGLLEAHYRLAIGGFLGLTIVGVSFQFYPPAIGQTPGVDDRTALAAITLLAIGLGFELLAAVALIGSLATVGQGLVVVGAALYAFIVLTLFFERR